MTENEKNEELSKDEIQTPIKKERKSRSNNAKKGQYTVKETENKWKKIFSSYSGSSFGSGGFGSGFVNGYFLNSGSMFTNDPYLLNQRIKQLKTSPGFLERSVIENGLLNPEQNELGLRQAMHSELYLAYPLYKLLMLYEGILTYNHYAFPKYVPKADMDTPRFKSDSKFMDMWLKKLNPKKQFRRMVAEILAEGKRAYYLRQSYKSTTANERVDYVHFQELPSDWWKIIKKSTDSHYTIAFNFAYFWMPGTSTGQFDPIFAQYYNELMGVTEDNGGVPQININKIKNPNDVVVEYNSETMTWYYWKELPSDKCFVFSFDESNATQISPFSSLLLTTQDLSTYSLLQQQLLSVPLYSIILGQVQMHDENKSGASTDDFRLSPEAIDLFEGKINQSLPPGVSYSMTPSSNNTMYNFKEIPNADSIYSNGLQQMIATSGTTGLLSTTDKPSVAMVNTAQTTEMRFIDRLYEQFMQACNITLREMYENGDLKYEWEIRIFGNSFKDTDKESDCLKGMGLGQKELLPEYLAYHNLSLQDANGICDYIDSIKIYDKFQPLVNSFTTANGGQTEKKNGRPTADVNNLQSDSTASNMDNGTNTAEARQNFSGNINVMSSCKCPSCGNIVDEDNKIYPFCNDDCREEYIEQLLEERNS
ncbi:hypothetical protein [Clostridium sp.]|uniref:hypothetical protein n=1 Tax=Clostridium sp. TaxID=1506 RepID=UPI00261245E3|nr:hypothetical protein [Clostridium sp.]